jgi:hypothetical protein
MAAKEAREHCSGPACRPGDSHTAGQGGFIPQQLSVPAAALNTAHTLQSTGIELRDSVEMTKEVGYGRFSVKLLFDKCMLRAST